MRTLLVSAIVVSVALAVGLPLVEAWHPEPGANPPVRPVGRQAPREVFASGYVEGQGREIDLRFEVAGRLASVDVQEGAHVQRGDLLARLDDAALRHARDEAQARLALAVAERMRLENGASAEARAVAQAEIEVAQVRAEVARKRFERAERLNEKQHSAISADQYDTLQADYQQALAELALAKCRAVEISAAARQDELRMADAKIEFERAQLRQAEVRLEKTELRAPSNGVILKVRAEPGELRGSTTQQVDSIISMVSTSVIHVRAQVEELDAIRVRPGMPARVTVDGLHNAVFRGKVVFCSPFMIPKQDFSNRPGERVDVKVREVVVALDPDQQQLDALVIGLPVDVYLAPAAFETKAETVADPT